MPICKKYCDKSENVVGTQATVDLRDDAGGTSGWAEISLNALMTEMAELKQKGLGRAMHLKSGNTYKHFCPGYSNMTLIGNSVLDAEYALGDPRSYACLHLVQPSKIWMACQDTPDALVTLSFEEIAKARYSAWWHHRDPKIWRRANIGNGYFPDKTQGAAVEIGINFCVEIG